MILARFYFKPEFAESFIYKGREGQTVIEMEFDDPMELVETCKQFEDYMLNCTAMVDGTIIDLRAKSGL